MKTLNCVDFFCFFFQSLISSAATVHYVNVSNPTPAAPYTSWATAATTIQDAVDVSVANDEILVTNGVYGTGGRPVFGIMTNRVTVDKAVSLRSVNGPAFTTIQGRQIVGSTNGDGAVRCVYLATNSSMSGFTIRNGATRSVGDYPREEAGGGVFCESLSCTISNCVMTGNSSELAGGGAYGGTLDNCLFTANWAGEGGAVYGREVQSVFRNCVMSGNSAAWVGGGVAWADLSNCILVGNRIDTIGSYSGGGAFACTLNNCTVVSNTAPYGGGADSSDLKNCIVYFNSAQSGPNHYAATLNYCCTDPDPGGEGNIPPNPLFVDVAAGNLRLQSNSPCINLGLNAYVTASADLDGLPRVVGAAVDIGAYEFQGQTSAVLPYFLAEPTNQTITVGGIVTFSAKARGTPPLSYQWGFNGSPLATATDSDLILDDVQLRQAGNYSITVTNVAGSVTRSNALLTVNPNVIHYVDQNGASPSMPYTNWATAALTIQEAIDVAAPLDEIIVTNGVYATGGKAIYNGFTNRVAITKPVKVRSVNGPQFTSIEGYQVPGTTNGPAAIRCVYLTNGARLVGFTLTNGATSAGVASSNDYYHQQIGGGVWCESGNAFVTNCVVQGNSSSDAGGGAAYGTFYNCTFISNICSGGINNGGSGGGAIGSTLNKCILSGNVAVFGGGAQSAILSSCLLAGNLAVEGAGSQNCSLNFCILSGNSAEDILVGNTIYQGGIGGGASGGSLNTCLVTSNAAKLFGGGAAASTLINCTLVGNSAAQAGGGASGESFYGYTAYCTLTNCIAYFNSAPSGANFNTNCVLNYCCTTPLPSTGSGNIANDPLFLDLGGGNARLQSNSPCVNAGGNLFVVATVDLDGRQRVVGGTVDLGAYEFQPGISGLFLGWLQQFGLPTDGSADYTDPDSDGRNNWQEWRCQTNPTNALSVLRMISAERSGNNVSVTWQSVAGVKYFLERSANLGQMPAFATLATNITGEAGTTSYSDLDTAGAKALFYRVGVGN